MTTLDLDLEAVEETAHGTPFHRWTAAVIGTIAVLASILALLQVNASQEEQRASLMATRLSTAISERVEASSLLFTFSGSTSRDALALAIEASSRTLTALQSGDPTGVEQALARPDEASAEQLQEIAAAMGAVPQEGGPLDPHTAEVLRADIPDLEQMVMQQNQQVDMAETWATRSSRAVLGLTLLALGGVLSGLAASFGAGRAGRVALVAAAAAVAVAALSGAASLLA